MRPYNAATVFYLPETPPADPKQIGAYIERELEKVKVAIDLLAIGHLDKTYVAPTKPRDGDIRYADGTRWNPVAGGEGFYGYYAGAWHKLG